jgi:hypothetical protein
MTHNANSKTVAIEFAEYMAKSAERFIAAANAVDAMRGGETHPDDGTIYDAEMELTEARTRLEADIYEFRKRRDRANG